MYDFKVLTPCSLIFILYKTSNLFVTFFIHLVSESCKYYTLCINLTALMHILHVLSISHKIFFWKSHKIANLYKASNEECNRIVICQRDIQHQSTLSKEYVPIYNLTIYISLSNMYYEFAFQWNSIVYFFSKRAFAPVGISIINSSFELLLKEEMSCQF